MAVPLSAGNALRLWLRPPSSVALWRILRREDGAFAGPDDAAAVKVYEGGDACVLDTKWLENDRDYFYCVYYRVGSQWTPSDVFVARPVASYQDASTDVPSIVRDRLDLGLQVEVQRGKLRPQGGDGIKALDAPPVWENLTWPLVTVHLQNEGRFGSAIGEQIDDDVVVVEHDWDGCEGWLARVTLTIVGWSQNADERKELRKAMRRIVAANMAVFDDAGMSQVEVQMQDIDAVSGEYPALVYQTVMTLTCVAPVRVVTETVPAVQSVEVQTVSI